MSAFIVHPMVRARILRWLGQPNQNRLLVTVCRAAGVDPTRRWHDGLDKELWRMNAEAVKARYGTNWDWNLYSPAPEVPIPEDVQVYCDLGCYLYQCTEGNVPHWSLYEEVEAAAQALANMIVTALPAYKATTWNWDGTEEGRRR